jgi:putative hydrolase of the HAD superfamily
LAADEEFMPRAFLFDLDDTLLDRRTSVERYAKALHDDFEIPVPLTVFTARFMTLDRNGRSPRPEFFATLASEFLGRNDPAPMRAHFDRHAWVDPLLFPDSLTILNELRSRGLATGIVTNGSTKSQSAKLQNSGLAKAVDHCIISEAFGTPKPAPEIFVAMCARLGADPGECVFIGDDPLNDVVAPSKLGMDTVWIRAHLAWPDDTPCPANHRVARGELRNVIERLLSS